MMTVFYTSFVIKTFHSKRFMSDRRSMVPVFRKHTRELFTSAHSFRQEQLHGCQGSAFGSSAAVTWLCWSVAQADLALSHGLFDLIARSGLFCSFPLCSTLPGADRLQRFPAPAGC